MTAARLAVVVLGLSAGLAACPGGPGGDEVPAPAATATDPEGSGEPPESPASPGSADPTDPADAIETVEPGAIEPVVISAGLEVPWDVAFSPDGRVFVTERDSGRLLELTGGQTGGQTGRQTGGQTRQIARLPVDASGEGGLLGLAASPRWDDDPVLYVYFTSSSDNRVVTVRADGPAGDASGAPEPILTGIPSAANHNGGRVAFGPDGMLYVTTGDAGQPGLAQDVGSLAGKILRLRPDGQVPDDNPFPDSPVYALGLRNPQGLAWTADGRLYATEFGPNENDEINLVHPATNYGWPTVSGVARTEPFADPVFVRQPPEASWSGLAALDGGAIPAWDGSLFAASLRGQRLWRLELTETGDVAGSEELLSGAFGRLRHVTQAPDGSLWVLTSNRDGRGSPAAEDDRIIRLGP